MSAPNTGSPPYADSPPYAGSPLIASPPRGFVLTHAIVPLTVGGAPEVTHLIYHARGNATLDVIAFAD